MLKYHVRKIHPISRQKKGLINPLGPLIKIITGNMDHDDAIKKNNTERQNVISQKMKNSGKAYIGYISRMRYDKKLLKAVCKCSK